MASKKFKLDISSNRPLTLIGILTDEPDLKLSWLLNKKLGIKLSRDEDLAWLSRELPNPLAFPVYSDKESNIGPIRLLKNRSIEGLWIKGYKQVDYLFMIMNQAGEEYQTELIRKLQNIGAIRGAYTLDPAPLKEWVE